MRPNIDQQRQQLMRDGYVILREMIRPDELETLRVSVDAIVEKAKISSGRVTMTDWVDKQTGNVGALLFGHRLASRHTSNRHGAT